MIFVLDIWILTEDANGWKGSTHWPTLHIYAPTRKDAEGRVADIMKSLPETADYHLVEV